MDGIEVDLELESCRGREFLGRRRRLGERGGWARNEVNKAGTRRGDVKGKESSGGCSWASETVYSEDEIVASG